MVISSISWLNQKNKDMLVDELEILGEEWRVSIGKRMHRESELLIVTPENPIREQLIKLTNQHKCYEKDYVKGLFGLQALRDHKDCTINLYESGQETQNRVRLALALDCEMIETTNDFMACARISVVDVQGNLLLDKIIKTIEDPSCILDCRTAITGLNKTDIIEKGVSLKEGQESFAKLCCDQTVLIGHSLHKDLLALKFSHDKCIDTSYLYPVEMLDNKSMGRNMLHSLEYLSQIVLGHDTHRELRKGVHDSIEDSRISMNLVKYYIMASMANGGTKGTVAYCSTNCSQEKKTFIWTTWNS